MTDKSADEAIREAIEALAGRPADESDIDFVRVYQMEQLERANELYEAAVGDGVNFATTDGEGDVFVNTKWLGTLIHTITEGMLLTGGEVNPMATVEVLGQTIVAADKFVGKR